MTENKPFIDNINYPYKKCLSCAYYCDWLACFTCTFKSKYIGAKCGHCGSVLIALTRKELNFKKLMHEGRACGIGSEFASKISWLGVKNIMKDGNLITWE